jgi:hypothetical protein
LPQSCSANAHRGFMKHPSTSNASLNFKREDA